MQSLCTLRNHCRQRPRNTRYQADATPYLGRTFTGWIAPACGWRTYSITSSARASSVGGTSRPSALAVFRLMTSSNLVGCSTGRSAGFAPAQDLVDELGGAPEQVREVGAVGHQAARFDVVRDARTSSAVARPAPSVLMRTRLRVHERVANDIECVRAALERVEGGRDILRAPDFDACDLEAERAGRRLDLAHLRHGAGIAGIGQDRQPAQTGDNLAQDFEAFAGEIGRLVRQAGDVAARSRQARDQTGADRVARQSRTRSEWSTLPALAMTPSAVAVVTMTSTLSRTNSAAISAMRSLRPSAQRYSIATVRPSIQPSSRSRCTKASVH